MLLFSKTAEEFAIFHNFKWKKALLFFQFELVKHKLSVVHKYFKLKRKKKLPDLSAGHQIGPKNPLRQVKNCNESE